MTSVAATPVRKPAAAPAPATAKSSGGTSFLSSARVTPVHGYTPATIARKRFRENTTALAISIGFVIPTLTEINKRLEKHVNEGTDVPMDEIVDIFVSCGTDCAKNYADRLARVATQTGFACLLIQRHSAAADSMVYLWDLYPRLMNRYVGELFALLRVPRFFASMFGPAPTPDDVVFLTARASVVNAFADSLKRNAIFLVADVVVDTARTVIDPNVRPKDRAYVIARKVVARSVSTVCWACGAAVSRFVAGERGEYWGEYLGTVAAPAVLIQVLTLMENVKKTRSSSSSGGGGSGSRNHSGKKRSSSSSSRPRSSSSSSKPAPTAAPATE